jgi:hypothetical protein
VRSAERREEIVQRLPVGHVGHRQPGAPFVPLAMEEVVVRTRPEFINERLKCPDHRRRARVP